MANGLLSLAEVDKGVSEDLKMGDVICKAVIMRAYQAAKNVNQSQGANADYIDITEFRVLLLYLRQYLELWVMFDAIDTNKDKRIDRGEFAAAAKLVDTWGLKVADPDAVFKEIDSDGGGMILFDEFADWAIKKKLDLPDDDDAENAGAGSGVTRTAPDIKPRGGATKKPASPPGGKSPAAKAPVKPVGKVSPAPAPKPKTPAAPPASRTPAKKDDKKEEQKVSVGIKFDANQEGGLKIEKVTPDTPAHKGGVQAGDKLVSISSKPIQNKNDFVALLPSFVAGAVIDVVVKRGESELSLKMSF